MELFIALLPLVLLFALIVLWRVPARSALAVALLVQFLAVFFVWHMDGAAIAAAVLKGSFVAVEIMLIVSGALVLFGLAKALGCVGMIESDLLGVRAGKGVIVIVVAWAFGALIEGSAGFGVPAALAAPLLLSAGFAPHVAVALALIANSVPVSFGALGTPVLIGIGSVAPHLVGQVSRLTAVIHGVGALFIPALLLFLVRRWSGVRTKWRWAVFASVSFVVPYVSVAWFAPAFASFIAGGSCLLCLLLALRARVSLRGWAPYVFAGVVLVMLRALSGIFSVSFSIRDMFTLPISYTFSPFLSPGVGLLIACLVVSFVFRPSLQDVRDVLRDVSGRSKSIFIALVSATIMVQLITLSSYNTGGFPSIGQAFAAVVSGVPSTLYVLLAPFIGGLGGFIAGSNTVSNLLFGAFQLHSAVALGLPESLVLALQNVGGAAGNMLALHNIVAACAMVGLVGREFEVLRKTVLPSIMYMLFAGILGVLIVIVFS